MAAPGSPAQAAFLDWLKRNGAYVSPKLDLFGPGLGGDRTVRAREAVAAGESLLLVPEAATLTMAPDGAASRCGGDGGWSRGRGAAARGAARARRGGAAGGGGRRRRRPRRRPPAS
jgi:hypothetical protein